MKNMLSNRISAALAAALFALATWMNFSVEQRPTSASAALYELEETTTEVAGVR